MGYITYKQADSRWGKLNYNGSSTMATAGCGPTAVAMLGYAVAGKSTPVSCMKYMQKHGYAIRNNGTAWAGIPACMRACGLQDVKNVAKMADVFSYLSKGYCAVFLFRAGSRGGITWTTAGHYIAVTDYKVQNGKHYLYTRDSGGRNHTGWYCYETQMKGLIPQVWVGKVPSKASPKPVTPAKTPVKCIDVSEHQGNIDWKKVKASGINHVIIRAGYGKGNIDKHFSKNISEAIKAGIQNIGIYWFMYSYTDAMAANEAAFCIKAIAPYRQHINMFVSADWEYDSMNYAKKNKVTPSKALITKMNQTFCNKIAAAGYTPAVYYNYDYKANHLDLKKLPFLNWYALDSSNGKFTSVTVQQYSTKGKVSGITGNVDMNWIHNTSFIRKPAAVKTKPAATTAKSYTGTFPDLNNLGPDLISGMARKLAWPYGTKESKYKYPSGSATAAFNSAIVKVFPNRSGWREQCKKGASCDVFVGTVVRASGHDTGFPRGLSDVHGHVKKKSALWKIINDPSSLKAGDVVEWGTGSAGHIFVYMSESREAEANLNGKHYGHISKKYVPSNPKVYRAYRPIGGRKYLIQGDSCTQVGYLQMFLNWCLDLNLMVDCDFGSKTAEAVRAFQKKYALTPDAVFGTASLAKAKAVKK